MHAQVWARDGHHCTATWHNVVITIWHDTVELVAIDKLAEAVDRSLDEHPDGIALLGISRPQVTMVPGAEERTRLSDLLQRHGRSVRCIGSVILGDSFVSAAKRTVLSTISMLARQPAPLRMFADLRPAADWMTPQLGLEADSAALLAAVEALERDYDAFVAENADLGPS